MVRRVISHERSGGQVLETVLKALDENSWTPEAEKARRLLDAAPDLLAALEEISCMNLCADDLAPVAAHAVKVACAAIAKAKGKA